MAKASITDLVKRYNKRVDLRRIQASNGRWYINAKLKDPTPKPSMTTIDSIIDKYYNHLLDEREPFIGPPVDRSNMP